MQTHASTGDSVVLHTLDGKKISLDQYQQPVYLKFWASYCHECIQEMPALVKLYGKYHSNLEMIAVNIDMDETTQTIKNTQEKFKLPMTIALDKTGELAKEFDLLGTPYHVILNKDHQVVYSHFGPVDYATLKTKFDMVIANKLSTSQKKQIPESDGVTDFNNDKTTILFFQSTYCDWYFKNSRPELSKSCNIAQQGINQLLNEMPDANIKGIVTRLWTTEKDLSEYQRRMQAKQSLVLDTQNKYFYEFKVKKIPTIIVLKQGKETLRVDSFNDKESFTKLIKSQL